MLRIDDTLLTNTNTNTDTASSASTATPTTTTSTDSCDVRRVGGSNAFDKRRATLDRSLHGARLGDGKDFDREITASEGRECSKNGDDTTGKAATISWVPAVLKEFKESTATGRSTSFSTSFPGDNLEQLRLRYLEQIEASSVAHFLAEEYNKVKAPEWTAVHFLTSHLVEVASGRVVGSK
jgi:hypothetical protein